MVEDAYYECKGNAEVGNKWRSIKIFTALARVFLLDLVDLNLVVAIVGFNEFGKFMRWPFPSPN